MPKFILEESQDVRPVRVYLEIDADGDVLLSATDGVNTALIASLLKNGRLCLAEGYAMTLGRLGFVTKQDHIDAY